MIPSKNLEDDIALRELRAFLGEPVSDRRQLALACLSKLVPYPSNSFRHKQA
jgi:hypothetical protein